MSEPAQKLNPNETDVESWCEKSINLPESEKIINFTKWYTNHLINFFNWLNNVKMNDPKEYDMFIQLLKEIRELSSREVMNDYNYLFSKRQKAWVCRMLLDQIKCDLTDIQYEKIKEDLSHVFFENWTRQILPKQSWIIYSSNHKKELYLNAHKILNRWILEQREYIWISPNAYSDLDYPSVVTALTPAKYEQPWHDHWDNWEITFYAWKSIAKYKNNWIEKEMDVDFWDIVMIPPKIFHTIYNPNDHDVRNISVKLPWALLDRWKIDQKNIGIWSIRKMNNIWNWESIVEFKDIWIEYNIRVFDFSNWCGNREIIATYNSMLYVLWWDYVVQFDWETRKNVINESDSIILEPWKKININSVNQDGFIYMVEYFWD